MRNFLRIKTQLYKTKAETFIVTLIKVLLNKLKTTSHRSIGLVLLLTFTSCGLFGNKDSKNKTATLNQSTGCLDRLGPLFNEYINGEVNPVEWTTSWECVDSTLETFTQYVQGSAKNAYTQEDVKLLIGRFIITRKPITSEFISSIFSLKASLFGGNNSVLTKDEILKFRQFIAFLKIKSLPMIPKIWAFHHEKSRVNLNHFSDDLQIFSNEIAIYLLSILKVDQNISISKSVLIQFITELGKNSMNFDQAEVPTWISLFMEIKSIFLKGNTQELSPLELVSLFKLSGDLGSKFISLDSSQKNEDTNAKLELLSSLKNNFNVAFKVWGGKIPFSIIENIVNLVPNRFLPSKVDEFKDGFIKLFHPRFETSNEVTTKIPSAFSLLLKNKSPDQDGYFYQTNINELLNELGSIFKMEKTIDQIYENQKTELSGLAFEQRLRALSNSQKLEFNSQEDNERMIQILKTQKGLFSENSSLMRFNGIQTHSKTSALRLLWLEKGAKHLLDAYGYRKDTQGNSFANLSDLNHLVKDINPLLNSFSLLHPDAVDVYKKRFREINLFMFNSNGDTEADINEVTEYISVLIAGSAQASLISKAIFDDNDDGTRPCKKIGMDEKLQLPSYDIECFRREFYSSFSPNYIQFPFLLQTLQQSSAESKDNFFKKIEAASRFDGYSPKPITDFDMSSYAGIAHYVEIVMQRFDNAGGKPDGILNRKEVLKQVFPVFENELKNLTNIKIKFVNQAILLYLMQYGASPFKCSSKPTKSEITSLLKWLVTFGPFKPISANRLRIYEIFGELSSTGASCTKTMSQTMDEPDSLDSILNEFPMDLQEDSIE